MLVVFGIERSFSNWWAYNSSEQSEYDPCYFWKKLADGSRMDVVIYVDDGFVVDSYSSCADAELEALHHAFTVDVKPARFFLGTNIIVHDQKSVESAAGAP